jgi:type IV secretory pathway TraG/TraD family ATPase VirD4
MATALCEAGEGGLSGADAAFWGQLSAKLLSPLLLAAHLADGSLEDVGRWIDERSVGDAIGLLEEAAQDEAVRWLEASFDRDDRQLSSVLATIEAVLAPLLREADAAVEAIDPARLLAEDGTLFLCAPAHEQRRYRPLFTSVTQVLLEEAFARARLDGGRLRRPLLVVLDEAAAIAPLAELDVIAATCASHGITLVTCFQDLAQVRARYGERASTLVNNHRTRVLLAGLADPGAAELLGTLVGSTLGPGGRTWFRAGQPTPERRALVEPHELRQLPEHTAVVVCERLHPVRVALEPWWRQRAVRGRGPKRPAGYAAGDASGSRPNR